MSPVVVRAYLLEALEFLGYFVLTATLGGAMYWLVQFRPHSEAKWYILASAGAAVVSVLYAARMYYLFRISFRRRNARAEAPEASPDATAPSTPRLSWSERIAAEQPERAARARAALAQAEAEAEAAANADDPAMSLDAIKARIAERMQSEDKEQEEARRIIEKFGGRN
ncbi:hypothetical protein [Sphingomonas hengshuiensis]|uniref:Uncharacterized protein n=1 Tax=Sphingomonas hengshuiensis TaxID=1609977 RepID=A0A7U4J8I7_9SPHN|nr:hypothetical protein [Sphingomonas hengshuiensis]AJP72127.1 hypothetical protein TS85_10530 [Sphingomonas hengshuiensis]